MFATVYQNGEYGIEIFSPSGNDPFKMCRLNNESNIKKVYDRTIKGYMAALEKEGATTSMQIPRSSKSTLGITQPLFVIQIQLHPEKSFSLELILLDSDKQRRRFHLSTNFKDMDANNLHVCIPWMQPNREDWTNVAINLADLVSTYSSGGTGVSFTSLESFTIQPVCRIRKIFTLPMKYLGDDDTGLLIPPKYDFTSGVDANSWVFSYGNTAERAPAKAEPTLVTAKQAAEAAREGDGLGIIGKKVPRREPATKPAPSTTTTVTSVAEDTTNKRHKPEPAGAKAGKVPTTKELPLSEQAAVAMDVIEPAPAVIVAPTPSVPTAPVFSSKLKQKLTGASAPAPTTTTVVTEVSSATSNTKEDNESASELEPVTAPQAATPPRPTAKANLHQINSHHQSVEEDDMRQSLQDYSAIDDFVKNYSTIAPTLPITQSMDMDVAQLTAKLNSTTTTPVTKSSAANREGREYLRVAALRNTSEYWRPPARVLVDAAVSPMPESYLPAPPVRGVAQSGDNLRGSMFAEGTHHAAAQALPMEICGEEPLTGSEETENVLPMEERLREQEQLDAKDDHMMSIEEVEQVSSEDASGPTAVPAEAPQQSIEEVIAAHRKPPSPPMTPHAPTVRPSTAVSSRPHSAGGKASASRPATAGAVSANHEDIRGSSPQPHAASPVVRSAHSGAEMRSPADLMPTEEPELLPAAVPAITYTEEPSHTPPPLHSSQVAAATNALLSPFSDAVAYFEARRSQQGTSHGRPRSARSSRSSLHSSVASVTGKALTNAVSASDNIEYYGASSGATDADRSDHYVQNEEPNRSQNDIYMDEQSDFAIYKARSSAISVSWKTEIDELLDNLQPALSAPATAESSVDSASSGSPTGRLLSDGQSNGAPTPLPEKKKRAIKARVADLLKQVEEAEMEYIAEFGFDAFEKDVGFFEDNAHSRRQ